MSLAFCLSRINSLGQERHTGFRVVQFLSSCMQCEHHSQEACLQKYDQLYARRRKGRCWIPSHCGKEKGKPSAAVGPKRIFDCAHEDATG